MLFAGWSDFATSGTVNGGSSGTTVPFPIVLEWDFFATKAVVATDKCRQLDQEASVMTMEKQFKLCSEYLAANRSILVFHCRLNLMKYKKSLGPIRAVTSDLLKGIEISCWRMFKHTQVCVNFQLVETRSISDFRSVSLPPTGS